MRTVRFAPFLGGASLVITSPFWERYLPVGNTDRLLASDSKEDLYRLSPKARYWTAKMSPTDCLNCHSFTDNIKDKKHIHESKIIKCLLCAQGCIIKAGQRGKCRARFNLGGELRTLVYGRPIAIHVDPIEKKPLYHFLPGSDAFSLATSGCPLRCKFCQNWEISQASPEDYQAPHTPPSSIVKSALSRKSPVIAFTYNEPTVFMEYMTDIAQEARNNHLRSVLISCGIMNRAPLNELCKVLDAIKIDLKGYSESFYRNVCGAELRPVLRSIKQIVKSHTHLEIVNLVVPTLNDSENMLSELVNWILGELGPDVPLHFNRFHPDYQLLNLPPTPVATLELARDMAMRKGLRYAYVGNVPGHPGNHTYCPSCKKIVIKRTGFFIQEMNIKDGHCIFCRQNIAGVWM